MERWKDGERQRWKDGKMERWKENRKQCVSGLKSMDVEKATLIQRRRSPYVATGASLRFMISTVIVASSLRF